MGDEQRPNVVQLGEERYELQPQPYPRLFRQLSQFGEELQSLGDLETDDVGALVGALGSRVHGFLRIFIPNLMAEYRFAGYATQAAFDAGELDEQAEAGAPTVPQIVTAVERAFEVNGGRRLGELAGKVLGPALGQAARQLVAARLSETLSQGSTSSPSPPAGAAPNGSTPANPTPVSVGVETGAGVGMSSGTAAGPEG